MNITSETKIFLGIILATVVIIIGALFFFSKPTPSITREEMIPPGITATGSADAKVYLVEFSDFQCPACGAFKPYVDEIRMSHKDKLLFAYRHFPLSQHQFALPAAYAAEAAGEQGKFWEMYDFLFSNQEKLSDEKIAEGAKLLGLDLKKYGEDTKSEKIKNKIEKDLSDGQKFGVNATPTFFLNGQKLELASFGDLKKAVDEALSVKN